MTPEERVRKMMERQSDLPEQDVAAAIGVDNVEDVLKLQERQEKWRDAAGFAIAPVLAGVMAVHHDSGLLLSDAQQPYRVDGLESITPEKISKAMQVSESNPMVGIEGRTSLLFNLDKALKGNTQFFGIDGRPGNIVDFLEGEAQLDATNKVDPLAALSHALIEGLNPIWPSHLSLGDISLGDVWSCPSFGTAATGIEGDDLHLSWCLQGVEGMTGLSEYRNEGFLVDFGVLTLKPDLLPKDSKSGLPHALPSHPAIVEWRAMAVIELDRIADLFRSQLGLDVRLPNNYGGGVGRR
ncbi:DUF1688-domain-containing protein [Phlegmacium glaucopus]|nr:DUF1688-domain-containing protein [Phlegmacium glaucopus]